MYFPLRQFFSLLGLAFCSFALTACLSADKPLIDRDNRVLPFTPPITIDVYDRESPKQPWRKQKERVTLVADDQLVVRAKGTDREAYVFYPLEPGRFLVEGRFKSDRPSYGVLEVKNGEGLLHHMNCGSFDQAAFKKAGGEVTGDRFKDCRLDKVANPLALLKALAAKPTGSQQRYVPVR